MKEIPEKKGLNLYRLSENCHFKLALESYVSVTPIIIDSEAAEPEFNSGHGLAPNASLRKQGMGVKMTIRCFFSILIQPAYY